VLCFEERNVSSEGSSLKKFSRPVSNASPIVLIEAFQSSLSIEKKDDSYRIIILRKDGTLECLSRNLEESYWITDLFTTEQNGSMSPSLEVQYAALLPASKIKSKFLKNRPDIAAQLESLVAGDEKGMDRISVICSVSRVQGGTDLVVTLTAIHPQIGSQVHVGSGIQQLVSWRLPEHPAGVSARLEMNCSFDLKIGLLHISTSDVIATYEFSQSVPKMLSVINDSVSPISAQVALPGSTALAASHSGYAIYDVKFNSVQDRYHVDSHGTGNLGKRRRDLDLEKSSSVRFLEFFSRLSVVIALRGRELLAIQLTQIGSLSYGHDSCLLINALGRGVDSPQNNQLLEPGKSAKLRKRIGSLFPDSSVNENSQTWHETIGQLEDLANKEDVAGFESIFAAIVGITNDKQHEDDQDQIPIYQDTHEPSAPRWTFPDYRRTNSSTIGIYREKAVFALRLIFRWEDKSKISNGASLNESSPALKIQFFPPNVFHWLVITGQLTRFNIEQAFRLYPGDSNVPVSISEFEMIDAIAHFDLSRRLLFSVINNHLRLEVSELVQGIRYIIQSLAEQEPPSHIRTITIGDETMVNGDEEDSVMDEADDAMEAVDFALSTLEHGIPVRGEALHTALVQLNGFSESSIVDALRASLNQQELIRLMNLLRLELEEGGWVSRYVDPDPTDEDFGDPSNHAISIISRILSCSVDAIGLNGWLATSASDPAHSLDGLLVALRNEIAIVLEGIHEATFMIGMLNEFLQFASEKRKEFRPKDGKPITTEKESNPELPLGLKVDTGVSMTKVSIGGEVRKRSVRDIGQQVSMKVPKYSFERIRV
jgi:hypothetical protein